MSTREMSEYEIDAGKEVFELRAQLAAAKELAVLFARECWCAQRLKLDDNCEHMHAKAYLEKYHSKDEAK